MMRNRRRFNGMEEGWRREGGEVARVEKGFGRIDTRKKSCQISCGVELYVCVCFL